MARAARLATERFGVLDFIITDAWTVTGPEVDEALTRFQLHLARRSAQLPSTDAAVRETHARTLVYYADLRLRRDEYVVAREEFANIATIAAATATSVAISMLSGGVAAPVASALVWQVLGGVGAAVGAGTAAAVTRFLVEGPSYVTPTETAADFVSGAVDGLVEVGAGLAIQRMAVRVSASTSAGSLARQLALAIDAENMGSAPLVRVGRPIVRGLLEGVPSGAAGAVVQTAMDEATWDQSQRSAWYTFLLSFIQGGLIGGAFGAGIGGLLGSPAELLGEAGSRGRLYGWFLDTNERHLIADVHANQWQTLANAIDALNHGRIEEGQALLSSIEAEIPDIVQRLLRGLVDPGKATLLLTKTDLERVGSQLDFLGVEDVLEGIDLVRVQRSDLPPSAQDADSAVILDDTVPGTRPLVRVLMANDTDFQVTLAHKELLFAAEVRWGSVEPGVDPWWKPLTLQELPTPEQWLGKTVLQKLEFREAFLNAEIRIIEQFLAAAPSPYTIDSQVINGYHDDLLFTYVSMLDDLEGYRKELMLLSAAKEDPAIISGGGVAPSGVDLDHPPVFAGRFTAPEVMIERIHTARVDAAHGRAVRARARAAYDALRLSLGEDLTPFSLLRIGWHRRVKWTVGGVDHPRHNRIGRLVMLGGAKRLREADVFAGGSDAWATVGQIPNWSTDVRAAMKVQLEAVLVTTAPGLDPAGRSAVAERFLTHMESSPVGFVLDTPPLRVADYSGADVAKMTQAALTATGPHFVPTNGARHHLVPLYMMTIHHLALSDTETEVALLARAMLDVPPPPPPPPVVQGPHDLIHQLTDQLEAATATPPYKFSARALRARFEAETVPGAAWIDEETQEIVYFRLDLGTAEDGPDRYVQLAAPDEVEDLGGGP